MIDAEVKITVSTHGPEAQTVVIDVERQGTSIDAIAVMAATAVAKARAAVTA